MVTGVNLDLPKSKNYPKEFSKWMKAVNASYKGFDARAPKENRYLFVLIQIVLQLELKKDDPEYTRMVFDHAEVVFREFVMREKSEDSITEESIKKHQDILDALADNDRHDDMINRLVAPPVPPRPTRKSGAPQIDRSLTDDEKKTAVHNYETFHKLPHGRASIEQVVDSSAGIEGYLKYEPEGGRKLAKMQRVPEDESIREYRQACIAAMNESNDETLTKYLGNQNTFCIETRCMSMRNSNEIEKLKKSVQKHAMGSSKPQLSNGPTSQDKSICTISFGGRFGYNDFRSQIEILSQLVKVKFKDLDGTGDKIVYHFHDGVCSNAKITISSDNYKGGPFTVSNEDCSQQSKYYDFDTMIEDHTNGCIQLLEEINVNVPVLN